MTVLSSDRLTLSPVRQVELQELHELHCDPLIVANLFDGTTPTIAETAARLEIYLNGWRQNGFGFWTVRERKTGLVAGRAGLRRFSDGSHVEFGHCYAAFATGRGIAAEAGRLIATHAFEELRLSKLVAVVMPHNERGMRIVEKLGMEHIDTRLHRGRLKSYFELTPDRLRKIEENSTERTFFDRTIPDRNGGAGI
jgi:[ribosomal protein S5]-alanine N-acetyltransferase